MHPCSNQRQLKWKWLSGLTHCFYVSMSVSINQSFYFWEKKWSPSWGNLNYNPCKFSSLHFNSMFFSNSNDFEKFQENILHTMYSASTCLYVSLHESRSTHIKTTININVFLLYIHIIYHYISGPRNIYEKYGIPTTYLQTITYGSVTSPRGLFSLVKML